MRPFLIFFLIICSCNDAKRDSQQKSALEIAQTDSVMSVMASKQGFHKALLYYADDSVVKPEEGSYPIIGRAALAKSWQVKNDDSNITWKPFKVETSPDGKLGYSTGYWKYAGKDTTLYGVYCTIWKKQADGRWKFVFDGGNNTPAPAPSE